MQIGEFTLANDEKVNRAIHGSIGSEGKLFGGVGEDDEDAILAEYDRLGGLIQMNGNKVQTGCFYDFKTKKAIAKPEPMLEFKIDGETIVVSADEPLPLEIRAAKQAAERKAAKKAEAAQKKANDKAAKKGKGKGGKKAKKDADEDKDDSDDEDEDGELA